jgi:hypothetical protein
MPDVPPPRSPNQGRVMAGISVVCATVAVAPVVFIFFRRLIFNQLQK